MHAARPPAFRDNDRVQRQLAVTLTVGAVLWTVILLAAPVALRRSSATAAVVYAAASHLCHQRPERSFHVTGIQLPVCARCFGLYVAGAAGAVLAWGSRRRPGDHGSIVLAVAAVPTALTWGTEVAGLAAYSNQARALAALPLGTAAGWLFVRMLRYDSQGDGHQIDNRGSRDRGR